MPSVGCCSTQYRRGFFIYYVGNVVFGVGKVAEQARLDYKHSQGLSHLEVVGVEAEGPAPRATGKRVAIVIQIFLKQVRV